MRFWKTVAIILLCCFIDGIVRGFFWGVDNRAWLYFTWLILSVGDIFYYILFAIAFEAINSRFNLRQSTKFSIIVSFTLTVICFFIFGSLRFWTSEQKTIMGFAYGLIGILYGYLYASWIARTNNN